MRREPRIHTIQLVSYRKGGAGEASEVAGLASTLDVSQHGLKVLSREPLKAGDTLHVEFAIDGQIVKAEARVRHVERISQYEVGLDLGRLETDERAKLEKFMAEHGIIA